MVVPLVVAILNVLLIEPSLQNMTTSCQYNEKLNGTCELYDNCSFYSSNKSLDHKKHFPQEISTCSTGYICCPPNNLGLLPIPPTCGFDLTNHISNGDKTSFYNLRFVVLLQYEKKKSAKQITEFHCGGTLISERYVLSAAHCVKSPGIVNEWDLTKVRLGEWNLNENPDCIDSLTCADKFVERSIADVKIHERYRTQPNYIMNDIMLIRFDRPIVFSDFIKPLCLPIFGSSNYAADLFQIVGWGRMEFNGPLSTHKRSGMVKMGETWSCAYALGIDINEFNTTLICTTEFNYADKSTSPCFGDSGGPLLQSTLSKYGGIPYQYLSGIISTGDSFCNSTVTPTLHTNVKYYINWIIENMRP